jgi:hypothetical protein
MLTDELGVGELDEAVWDRDCNCYCPAVIDTAMVRR